VSPSCAGAGGQWGWHLASSTLHSREGRNKAAGSRREGRLSCPGSQRQILASCKENAVVVGANESLSLPDKV